MAQDAVEPEAGAVVHLQLLDGYRFEVDFGDAFASLAMDEPEPLGAGSAPNASRVLGAAVGNCLSASLLFCLRRAHVEVEDLRTEVTVTSTRNEAGRLRIGSIAVKLHPQVQPEAEPRMRRCLELFEDFCVVTASVRDGIDVDVAVDTSAAEAPQPPAEPAG